MYKKFINSVKLMMERTIRKQILLFLFIIVIGFIIPVLLDFFSN